MPAGLKILVIEDDADDIEFLNMAFSENGVQVIMETLMRGDLINNYLEKVSQLPDLIIMDLNLPKMHGREVLLRIRGDDRFRTVPLAVLTTSVLEEDMNFCLKNGADKYFSKPSSPEGFSELVRLLRGMTGSPKDN